MAEAVLWSSSEGSGMGFRFSRSIVESHGGRWLAPANSSRAANFYFTLPLLPRHLNNDRR
jgi:signal transduction histidine kinase